MPAMAIITAIVFAACNDFSIFASDFPADGQIAQKATLFDFRSEANIPERQKIPAAEADTVLKNVFGEDYKNVADAAVYQKLYGAFTKPNVKETLYFISGGLNEEQQNLSRGESEMLSYIAVLEGFKLVFQGKVAAYGIHKTTDLNEDGKNELLLSNGFYNMGTAENGLELVEIENGSVQTIKEFGILYSNNCDSGQKGSSVDATVVSYVPTTKKKCFPQFNLLYYKGGCGKKIVWKQSAENPFSE
jgi:hypothetical protein